MNQSQQICGIPSERAQNKVRDHMVEWVQEFIRNSPFAVMASSDAAGHCDASPKGGPPGFVKVVDDRHLAIPDIAGNRLFQTYENIETNPSVGLFFLIPGIDATARVNGSVAVLRPGDAEFERLISSAFPSDEVSGIQQLLLLKVAESYSQCPKALTGSHLWNTSVIDQNLNEPPIPKWAPGT